MTLTEVLQFCTTATPVERMAIMNVLTADGSRQSARQATAAVTLSQIGAGDTVHFNYAHVQYEATVKKINRTTATVTITKIVGTPRRNDVFVGSTLNVGASILAREMAAGV